MAGIIQEVAVTNRHDHSRIEELGRIVRGQDGVTVDSVCFRFSKYAGESCCCSYSIWGNSVRVEWYTGTTSDDDALQTLQMLVASAILERLSFRFVHLNPDDSSRLMRAVCPVMCRLATLSFSFEVNSSSFDERGCWLLGAESGVRHFLETGFAVLLRDNPVFSQLTVAAEGPSIESLRDENRSRHDHWPECCSCRRLGMAYTFSRNPALKGSKAAWTLKVSCTCEPYMRLEMGSVQEMFMLFPVDNALLKEVVVTRECHGPANLCGRSREDMADSVARNVSTLEGLNADAEAVRCNRSPKEFQYSCTVAELHEFVRVFVPYWGRESNSSPATLKVHTAGSPRLLDCMVALAPLHGATMTALKEVVVVVRNKPWSFKVTLMGSDDSQPHPNAGCVTLSRLKLQCFNLNVQGMWPPDDPASVLNLFVIAIEEMLRTSTTLEQVEIAMPWGLLLDLQRTGSSRDLQLNLPRPVSALKLHFPDRLRYPIDRPSESVVAGSWMTLVKRVVATLEHVEAVHEPGHLAPWECERPTFERVEAVHHTNGVAPGELERGVQEKVREGLKRLLKEELRGNTWLQSLQVGWWRLVRVGAHHDEWEMRYHGPCLRRFLRRQDEYHVEVELQSEHGCFGR